MTEKRLKKQVKKRLLQKTGPKSQMTQALKIIDEEIRSFVESIVGDVEGSTDNVFYKTSIENMHYLLYLYNKESGQTVGHAWGLTVFLEMCANRKIEFEMNTVVRKMLIDLRDKQSKETIWVS